MTEVVEVKCKVEYVTKKALLVKVDEAEYWFPFSQIVDGGDLSRYSQKGDEGTLIVTKWIAGEKGLG